MSARHGDIARVTARIAGHIRGYLAGLHVGAIFTEADLATYVEARSPGTAPGSAGRVLRELRARGVHDVALLDRSAGLYQLQRAVVVPVVAWRVCAAEGHVWPGGGGDCERCGVPAPLR